MYTCLEIVKENNPLLWAMIQEENQKLNDEGSDYLSIPQHMLSVLAAVVTVASGRAMGVVNVNQMAAFYSSASVSAVLYTGSSSKVCH